MNNDRGRVHLNERRVHRGFDRYSTEGESISGYELPDAPENLDFEALHTEEQAAEIERRFASGFELRALYDARAARLVREAAKACAERFKHPRKRPDRKQRTLTSKLGERVRGVR